MNSTLLYWPTYESLEREVLDIANNILFDDEQANVYSPRIADVIVRCTVEIESIGKLLYAQLGGNTEPKDADGKARSLYFDTDCIQMLVDCWKLDAKKVLVVAPTFAFDRSENRILTPLRKANKRGTSGSRWKRAYQAIKHDKMNGITSATVSNMIAALAALYLLNIYLKSDRMEYAERFGSNAGFDPHCGSKVFSIMALDATRFLLISESEFGDCNIDMPEGTSIDEYAYVLRNDEASIRRIWTDFCRDSYETRERIKSSRRIAEFLRDNPDYVITHPMSLCLDAGGTELFREVFRMEHTNRRRGIRTEAIVNKHEGIYPSLPPEHVVSP